MHIKLTEGIPEIYTLNQLRRDNKHTSFPTNISEEVLALYSVYSYKEEFVDYDPTTQVRSPGNFYQDDEGNWILSYEVTEASWESSSESVRALREHLLSETDWVVIKYYEMGEEVPQEWLKYRQALRDITLHANFPYLTETDWPTKP
jgi:hypothetical protein